MSLNFLRRLAQTGLPYETEDVEEVDQITILLAAKLITAVVPQILQSQYQGGAKVCSITAEGLALLALVNSRDSP